ncbi:hypothetical protein IWW34DRAFT_906747 [Fusarium oxysporum f. sp. albedinis]|nr:hypothetical protein IWW34DRAFT_906747 [Fusarium oxysporum f. sp. albedinis]
MVFRGQRISERFRIDELTDRKIKRFLKAFLLHELNCKTIKAVPHQESASRRRRQEDLDPLSRYPVIPKLPCPFSDIEATEAFMLKLVRCMGLNSPSTVMAGFQISVLIHLLGPGLYSPIFSTSIQIPIYLQQKIFEQRPWIFCDDGRLYPLEITVPHFPSERFLEDEPENMGWFEGLGTLRCHSQEWHGNYQKSIELEVAQG